MTIRTFLVVVIAVVISSECRADVVRLRCTADTNVSSYESEREFNYGQSSRLRLKGIEMMALVQFDAAPVSGWLVKRATLYMRYAGGDRKLRTLGFSTISAPWTEGTGAGEKRIGETCFSWSALGKTRWAGGDTDFTDVSFTAGHTLASYADISALSDGWISAQVDPRLVQAIIAGASYGLAVSDEKGQTRANNDVYSREQSGSAPYLVVEGVPGPVTAPAAIGPLAISPDSGHADFASGALKITLTAPRDAFAYDVRISQGGIDHPVGRNVVPFAEPGSSQSLDLAGLRPDGKTLVEVTPVSASGVRGMVSKITGTASSAVLKPDALRRPATDATVGGSPRLHSGGLRVWAYPDSEKADPVSGNLLEEIGEKRYNGTPAGAYRSANAVWDGRTILLHSARNEFISFHLLVEAANGTLNHVRVTPSDTFQRMDGTPQWKVKAGLFRDWYVQEGNWFPEACIPLVGSFDIPANDNVVPNQRNQSVFIEYLVPRDVAPGNYHGTVSISADGVLPIDIPILIAVNALTLPDTLSFDISLNSYGTLGHLFGIDDSTPAYRNLEREYHRMAHAHRATLAVLGYSHGGNMSTNYAPTLAGTGANSHILDWSRWDDQFGPYLDGTAFADLPRRGVPITHLYLPFHEAWPVDIRAHYRYKQTVASYPELITEHALTALPVEQAFDKEFGDGFTAVARDFAEHFQAKGWTGTQFQFYQNDKHYYKDPKQGGRGTSWWLLDEPNHRDDWLALAYFDGFFRKGTQGVRGIKLISREDISRPQWQRDYLDGHVDLMVTSSELYTKGPRLREMRENLGMRYWNYGSANAVRRSNTEAEAWTVRAWLAGADGIVPWQSVGEDDNFIRADDTALLLPGKRFGIIGPIASLRLKALRRAQQDAEYLVQLAKARGWSRDQIGAALRGILTPGGEFIRKNTDDAGSYQFGVLRATDFADMRQAVADALAKGL